MTRAIVTVLRIPQQILDGIVAHARELDPHECCGLLGGKDGLVVKQYRITNTVAKDGQAITVFESADVKPLADLSMETRAEVAYFMDPKEMLGAFKDMRERALDLSVIYHSHTRSPAYPSMTDIGLAYYPDAAYLIVSLQDHDRPELKAYWIKDRAVFPASIQAV